jgi:hypothetical protein
MIHQRALGVVIAVICTLLIRCIAEKKIQVKNTIVFVAVLAVMIVMAVMVKNALVDNLYQWTNTHTASVNDFAGQSGKIKYLFTFDGMKTLIKGVCGKLFYFVVATAGVGIWGCYEALIRIRKGDWTILFMALGFAGMVAVGAIYMVGAGRIDTVMYGRYYEFTVAPIVLLGCYHLYRRKQKLYHLLIAFGLIGGFALAIKNFLIGKTTFQYLQVVAISIFYDSTNDSFRLGACVAAGLTFIAFIWFAGRKKNKVVYAFAMLLIVGYWTLNSQTSLYGYILYPQIGESNLSKIADIIRCIDEENDDIPVYFVYDYDNENGYENYRVEDIQYYMPEKTITLIAESDIDDLPSDHYIITCRTNTSLLDRYDVVTQAYGMLLLAPENSELLSMCRNYNKEHPYMLEAGMMNSATGNNIYDYTSNYKEGFVTYCQYLVLEEGRYAVTFDVVVNDAQNDVVGYLDVCADLGSTQLYYQELNLSEAWNQDGTYTVTYILDCEREEDDIELRLFSYGNANMELVNLSISLLE